MKIPFKRGSNPSIDTFERRPPFPLIQSSARLPDPKCHFSPHHWQRCSSCLALLLLKFLLRIVACRGNGYAIVITTVHSLALTSPDGSCIQSFNSLDQDPCYVTAYMLSTCNGGSESFAYYFILHLRVFIISSPLQCSPSSRCNLDTITLAHRVSMTLTCASAVPSDIRS